MADPSRFGHMSEPVPQGADRPFDDPEHVRAVRRIGGALGAGIGLLLFSGFTFGLLGGVDEDTWSGLPIGLLVSGFLVATVLGAVVAALFLLSARRRPPWWVGTTLLERQAVQRVLWTGELSGALETDRRALRHAASIRRRGPWPLVLFGLLMISGTAAALSPAEGPYGEQGWSTAPTGLLWFAGLLAIGGALVLVRGARELRRARTLLERHGDGT